MYFPEEAVIAMVDTTDDRRTVEVGIIGREGIVGINIFLGGVVTPDKAIVQLPGGAMRMKAKDLRKEVRFGSPLQRLLLDYTRTFLAVISQSVACSQHHNIEQRLARWLLTMNDYAGPDEFLMVHESIADMLGVRRESVTEAARKLQAAALISYSRGHIRVLDKPGLGEAILRVLSVHPAGIREPASQAAALAVREVTAGCASWKVAASHSPVVAGTQQAAQREVCWAIPMSDAEQFDSAKLDTIVKASDSARYRAERSSQAVLNRMWGCEAACLRDHDA